MDRRAERKCRRGVNTRQCNFTRLARGSDARNKKPLRRNAHDLKLHRNLHTRLHMHEASDHVNGLNHDWV